MALKCGAALAAGPRARCARDARARPARARRCSSPRRPPGSSRPTSSCAGSPAAAPETIAIELADVAELLRVAVDAGLTPMRALAEVGRRHPGLLAAELRAASARVALGRPARRGARPRSPPGRRSPASHALVAALGRAERHGAPLGPALAALAAEARGERARRVRDRAARAAPKIQLVVALLLVPAVLLMVAAALAAALL